MGQVKIGPRFRTPLYCIGTLQNVQNMEVFAFWGVHIEGFHCRLSASKEVAVRVLATPLLHLTSKWPSAFDAFTLRTKKQTQPL